MEERYRRQTAYKIRISDIIRGKYNKKEGDELSYMEVGALRVHRVNIMGTIVSMQGNNAFIIDDGSASISVRSFEKIEEDIKPGDLVLTIGKIRLFNEEVYIFPEIIKKDINPLWFEVRRLEGIEPAPPNEEKKDDEEDKHPLTRSDKIYELIKKMDGGSGAPVEDVILASKDPDAEKIILNLLKEGDIFEISPGKVKTLE